VAHDRRTHAVTPGDLQRAAATGAAESRGVSLLDKHAGHGPLLVVVDQPATIGALPYTTRSSRVGRFLPDTVAPLLPPSVLGDLADLRAPMGDRVLFETAYVRSGDSRVES
jgi:hypothetical protein